MLDSCQNAQERWGGVHLLIDRWLRERHELIKVKVAGEDRETKLLIAQAIVRETRAAQVQMMGNTLTLFRQAEESKFNLPRK